MKTFNFYLFCLNISWLRTYIIAATPTSINYKLTLLAFLHVKVVPVIEAFSVVIHVSISVPVSIVFKGPTICGQLKLL